MTYRRAVRFDSSIDIEIDEEVYNPSDDSYLLLKCVEVSPDQSLLEMGTGSGLIALHAAKLGAKVTAADMSPKAVECTRRNAARNNIRLEVVRSDLFERISGLFDVIAFNPPYLPGTASSTSWVEKAWAGGEEGSEMAVRFLEQAWRQLAPGGRIYVVLSSIGGLMSLLKTAKQRYESEMLEEKHLFFESIYIYRFRLRDFANR
ncbi:MAG: methyltransferase [Candidatus Thermoplasmatota archaeon]|nr:methyltransferase [Candidatus Thermoplasmatota archaeon]